MVKEFLSSRQEPEAFLKHIRPLEGRYNGFNLLVGTLSSLVYYSNRSHETKVLKPGIYGLSNHLLDTPWPKVVRTRRAFSCAIEGSDQLETDRFMEILHDRTPAAVEDLPDTGFGIEWERALSSPFIATPTYGTRASTVLLVDGKGLVRFMERSFSGPSDPGSNVYHEFTIKGF